MERTRITINRKFQKSRIDSRIYSSFVEHMGRVVYTGIYEPDHPTADKNGFREDVLEKVREMGVTLVRYPGGNFVSNYDWRDGVGDKKNRPKRLELAWRAVETNEVGMNEFMEWAKKAGVEPICAVNLGTKGIENAASLLEYCNMPQGTMYSDLRVSHGVKEPYGVKMWCLGNEMDGDWQIGHKLAAEYGRIAQETAKVMKKIDDSIELVACGSAKSDMPTYPEWEATVLDYAYEYIDYLALHQYYGGQEMGTPEFLAQSADLDQYISTVSGVCDYMKAKKRSSKIMYISVDEWGVWAPDGKVAHPKASQEPWQVAPHLSEQVYTMEDALLFASMLMSFQRHSDRVKVACQSLLTNISAAIMTEKGGEVWVQPIFYPFSYASKYGRGIVLEEIVEGPVYDCNILKQVTFVDSVTIYNEERGEIVIFAVSRCETEKLEICEELQGYKVEKVMEHVVLTSEDKWDTNLEEHDKVKPHTEDNVTINGNMIITLLHPLSWNMIRVKVSSLSINALEDSVK
ncbi:MAG: alpha-N-arabinofuranosidase [Lachnospiraceae bacterium]